MLKTRIIPVMLLKNDYFVKTLRFDNPEYVGDPINIVRIFNDKGADELTIFDIDVSTLKKEINYKLIEDIAINARMPLCYGGGISNKEQAKKIFSIGVEKIAISKGYFEDKKIIKVLSKQFGSQSIAVTLNINTFDNNSYLINDTVYSKECDFKSIIKEISQEGAGEIIINCIHRDGTNSGYDIKLIDMIYPHATTPLTFVGGANSYDHILELAKKYPLLGLGAGNLFIYKGKNKAVLISYPSEHSER